MIVRALLYGLLIWLIFRLIRSFKLPQKVPRGPAGPDKAIQGGELFQDPQCKVYIPREGAIRGPGGTYFCSEACRDAYRGRGS